MFGNYMTDDFIRNNGEDLSRLFDVKRKDSSTMDQEAYNRRKLESVTYTTKIFLIRNCSYEDIKDIGEDIKKKAVNKLVGPLGYDSLITVLYSKDIVKAIKKAILETEDDMITITVTTTKPIYYPTPKNALPLIGGKAYIDEYTEVKINNEIAFVGEVKDGKTQPLEAVV